MKQPNLNQRIAAITLVDIWVEVDGRWKFSRVAYLPQAIAICKRSPWLAVFPLGTVMGLSEEQRIYLAV